MSEASSEQCSESPQATSEGAERSESPQATSVSSSRAKRTQLTPEYKHQPDSFDLRGGPLTADHVDILGSSPLNATLSAGKMTKAPNGAPLCLRQSRQWHRPTR